MNPRKLVVLGSTGSIGRSTLKVAAAHPGAFEVAGLAAFSNAALLAEQYRRFRPKYLALVDERRAEQLRAAVAGEAVELRFGEAGLTELAELPGADVVVNAVVGAAGLRASLAAVRRGIRLALANKESLVAGGPLFPKILKRTGAEIVPIDSEHSALWQCLTAGRASEVRRLILTASGGPFRTRPRETFDRITPGEALTHPTWRMGKKITIDSATLANKGLEVIEAAALFAMPAEKIAVVIHPQSIVHSMVEYIDSSIIAQLSAPDMRLPITYALFWPDRAASEFGGVDPARLGTLTFEPPDIGRFPALRLAFEAARSGGTAPAVYSAANEVAVESFLQERIKFTDIAATIEEALGRIPPTADPGEDDIFEADRQARAFAGARTGKTACC